MFSQLEEVDDKPTEEMIRKGKKKLREIARLKLKNESSLTEEERKKLYEEKEWISIVYDGIKKESVIKKSVIKEKESIIKEKESVIKCKFNKKDVYDTSDCPICMESITANNIMSLGCGHMVCTDCVSTMIKKDTCGTLCCPLCREEITNYNINDYNKFIDISTALEEHERVLRDAEVREEMFLYRNNNYVRVRDNYVRVRDNYVVYRDMILSVYSQPEANRPFYYSDENRHVYTSYMERTYGRV